MIQIKDSGMVFDKQEREFVCSVADMEYDKVIATLQFLEEAIKAGYEVQPELPGLLNSFAKAYEEAFVESLHMFE